MKEGWYLCGYISETAECFKFGEKLDEFDKVICDSLENITNLPMSEDAWDQSSQPTGLGGLGIPKASEIALPADISSETASTDIVTSIVPENHLQQRVAELTVR